LTLVVASYESDLGTMQLHWERFTNMHRRSWYW